MKLTVPRFAVTIGVLCAACIGCSQHSSQHPKGGVARSVLTADSLLRRQTLLLSEVNGEPAVALDNAFRIANNSDRPCGLLLSRQSCACFRVRLTDGRQMLRDVPLDIVAGQYVDLVMDVHRPKTPIESKLHVEVRASGSDQESAPLQLEYHLRTYRDVEVSPGVLMLGPSSASSQQRSTLTLRRRLRSSDPLRFGRPTFNNLPPGIAIIGCHQEPGIARSIDTNLWEMMWTITIASHGRQTPIDGHGTITVAFSQVRTEIPTAIPYVIRRTTGIQYPEALHFGIVTSGATMERSIELVALDSIHFSIMRAECSNDAFALVSGLSHEGTRNVLRFTVHPKTPGECKGRVTLATNHPLARNITLSLAALCVPPTTQSAN
jgi:hypothetical protein